MINKSIYLLSKLSNKLRSSKVAKRRKFMYGTYLEEIRNDKNLDTDKNLVLSIDDISLKTNTLLTKDSGGEYPSKLYRYLDDLINYGYKPTLYYVPMPEYCYVSDSPMSHYLDFTVSHIHKKPQLLNYLLHHENNQHIEIAQHGLTHHNKKNYKYHSFEFDGINQSEILEKLKVGKKLLSDIFHISGFKPPAWSVGKLYDKSVEFSDSLQQMHYDYVSLSSPTNGLNYSSHCVSHIHKSKISEMINVPQNISVLWDKEYIKDVIREISHKNGIINVQIHFQEADKYLQDGLNEKIVDKLKFVFDETVRCGYRASLTRDVK